MTMYKTLVIIFCTFLVVNANEVINSTILTNTLDHTNEGFGKCVAFKQDFLIVGGADDSEAFSVGINRFDVRKWSNQFSTTSVPGWCNNGNVLFKNNKLIFFNKNTLMIRNLAGSFFRTIKTMEYHEILDVSMFNNIVVVLNRKTDGETVVDIFSFSETFITESQITNLQTIQLNKYHSSVCITGEYVLAGSTGGNGYVKVFKTNGITFSEVDVILSPPGSSSFGEKLYCEDNGLYVQSDESTRIHSFTLWASGWVSNGFVDGSERGNKIVIATNNNNIAIGDAENGLVNIYRTVGSHFILTKVFETNNKISSIALLQESSTLVVGNAEDETLEIYEWFDGSFETCPSYEYDFGETKTIIISCITTIVLLIIYAMYNFYM